MEDIYNLVKNIESVYGSNTSFQVLKDFERVIDELDVYVYKNWEDGELAAGPVIERHWVTCTFMWDQGSMPDPMGGKRLVDYDCKVSYKKDHLVVPRKIRKPDDIRPGTKKGKLDRKPVWLVTIQMPKSLIADMYSGYKDMLAHETEAVTDVSADAPPATQSADVAAQPAPEGTV